jgi:tRNA threonylcarbamoyladenosine biosynthesis protein TsaE
MKRRVTTEQEMEALGGLLARQLRAGQRFYLRGPLGAGKTTLVRGVLRGAGHAGSVKSPTFTLVEPYALEDVTLFHFDLYRLKDPQELEFMGIRDYWGGVCMIEWPEKGGALLPPADLDIAIEPASDGREVTLTAHTELGRAMLERLGA